MIGTNEEFTLWHLLLVVLGSSVLGALVTGIVNRLNGKDTSRAARQDILLRSAVAAGELELKTETAQIEVAKAVILDREADTRAHDAVTKAAEATGALYNELIDRMEKVTEVVTAKFEECQEENKVLRVENKTLRARVARVEAMLRTAGLNVDEVPLEEDGPA